MIKKVDDGTLIAYQTAINLYTHEGDIIWSRFNAMLVANSILVLSITQILTVQDIFFNKSFFAVFLSITGIISNIIWISIMQRGYDFHEYWMHCALELEEKFAQPNLINILRRCGNFKDGRTVDFEQFLTDQNHPFPFQMNLISRFTKIHWIPWITGLIFIIVYCFYINSQINFLNFILLQ